MTSSGQIVLSVSRRTDIPAFYLDGFINGMQAGFFKVQNPFNRKSRIIPVSPLAVHSIVFWSKNFGPLLKRRTGEELMKEGYHLFFNYTLNTPDPLLEPRVPPLDRRLEDLAKLCRIFGAACVNWRFDPVCTYRNDSGQLIDNLADFDRIAEFAAACGIQRCITSFLDIYPKIKSRAAKHGIWFEDPPLKEKKRILLQMKSRLDGLGIELFTCCEKQVLDDFNPPSDIRPSACIDHELLTALYGGDLSGRRDSGQRVKKGCGCHLAVDVGNYQDQQCRHGCRYCYANPVEID